MTTRRRLLVGAAAGIVLVLAGAAGERAAGAQQSGARLLTSVTSLAAPKSRALDPWERRARPVTLNSAAVAQELTARATSTATSPITIELFDGATVTAVFERFDPNLSGVTWVGRVTDRPGSLVTLVHGGGLLAGSIILPDASYTIRPAPADSQAVLSSPVHVLTEINSTGFQPEAEPIVLPLSAEATQAGADAPMADTADIVDVLAVYTARAEDWAGGPAAILNWINMGMSETNSAYAASGVHHRVRLVHVERVAYQEVGSFSTNLNNLRAGAAGLQTVPGLRNAYTADLVTMFVRPTSPDACGIGFLMSTVTPAFAANGFNVVDAPCSSPTGTLAHEFGHNMGLRHDWYVDAGVTPYTYAHGYVSAAGRFRTVMSYPNACSALAIACTRLLAFSNPELTHNGQPMGIAGGTSTACTTGNASNMSCDADERRALNNNALTVANFREFSTNRPPTIRTQPANLSVPRGQPIQLQVAAEGLGPFSYQWYRGAAPSRSEPIAGATGATLSTMPGTDGVWFERWFYWVQVSNTVGTVNSLTPTVTVSPPGGLQSAPQRTTFVPDPAARSASGSRAAGTAGPRARAGALNQPAEAVVPTDAAVASCEEEEEEEEDAELMINIATIAARAGDPAAFADALASLLRWMAKSSPAAEDRVLEALHVRRGHHPLQRSSIAFERVEPLMCRSAQRRPNP